MAKREVREDSRLRVVAIAAARECCDAWHFALHHAGSLTTGPLELRRHDRLPRLRGVVRTRLQALDLWPDGELLVVGEQMLHLDDIDLEAHLAREIGVVAGSITRFILSSAQVAELLGVPPTLDSATIQPTVEQDLCLGLPGDLDAGSMRAVAFAVAGVREMIRRATMVRAVSASAPLIAGDSVEDEGANTAPEVTTRPESPATVTRPRRNSAGGRSDTDAADRSRLSLPEVAALFGRSRMWIYRHVVGKIPSIRPPGSKVVWFNRVDVETLLAAWTVDVEEGREKVARLPRTHAHPDAATAAEAVQRWRLRGRSKS